MSEERGVGLDVGTCFLVSARAGDDSKTEFTRIRDAFFSMPPNKMMMGILKKAEVGFINMEDNIVVVGDKALDFAATMGQELRRPMNRGVVSQDNQAEAVMSILLEKVVGALLRDRSLTLSAAESCTGGRISNLITSIPGSSDYFKGSVISYSNEIKTGVLDVPAEIILEHGSVSRQVVEIMAKNIREKFKTDYSIAVSGIAGPSGGTDEKPVGTTWICISSAEKCCSKQYKFGEHRGRNIEIAAITAINLLRKMILGYNMG